MGCSPIRQYRLRDPGTAPTSQGSQSPCRTPAMVRHQVLPLTSLKRQCPPPSSLLPSPHTQHTNALAASVDCEVLADRWFRPHFAVSARFGIGAWSAEIQVAQVTSLLARACWIDCPDRSRYSSSQPVQKIWETYLELLQFVPVEVRHLLYRACLDERGVWCKASENGLLHAYTLAVRKLSGNCLFTGRNIN